MAGYNPKYREENKEELARKRAERYERNRRKYLGLWSAYHSEHPEVWKKHRKKREAKIRAGKVTRADLEEIVRRDEGKCIYCRTEVRTNCTPSRVRGFDHLIHLLSDEGEHATWNLAVCCVDCNADKASTDFGDYVIKKGYRHLGYICLRAWGLEEIILEDDDD